MGMGLTLLPLPVRLWLGARCFLCPCAPRCMGASKAAAALGALGYAAPVTALALTWWYFCDTGWLSSLGCR
jgi:hypothetical protein